MFFADEKNGLGDPLEIIILDSTLFNLITDFFQNNSFDLSELFSDLDLNMTNFDDWINNIFASFIKNNKL